MQELEENNIIVKSIGFFRKIGATRGTLLAKMGTIKDSKVKDILEADEIKRRWQEYRDELYKNDQKCQIGMMLGSLL